VIPCAALTGLILWLSSVLSGWLENWAVYQQIPEVISTNRKIVSFLGKSRAEEYSKYFVRNIAGFGSSVSLGFLLAAIPVINKFFGIPVSVQHVTLSTGSLTFAVCTLPSSFLKSSEFIFACFGIILIGCLNFGVSFAMALIVALRARNVSGAHMRTILRAAKARLKNKPLEFFIP